MPINANVSGQPQITASVGETKIDVSVSGGVGPTGSSGTVSVAAPITNSGTSTAANIGLSVGTGLSVSGGSLIVTPGAYATLVDGRIPAGQLPSYVDDVVEVAGIANLPPVGESGKIYVTADNNRTYRWSGSTYVEISASPGSSDSVPEGVTNLYFTAWRALAAVTWSTLTGKPSTFAPSTHQHVAADISDFTSAVVAAAPPTTNASLLTSGTLPDARLSSNIARTSDVTAAVAAVVNAAPAALDTLNELAAALGNDASFATTVTNALAAKAPLASPTFTGTVSGITKAMVGLGNADNTSDANKPISAATQTALDGKAALLHTHNVTDVTGAVSTSDSRLTDQRTPTDGSVTDAKITSGGLSASSINWVAIQPWAANTAYNKGDLVSFEGVAYRRTSAGTSGATFNTAMWQAVTPATFVGSQITSGTVAAARLGSGTADATTVLYGNGTWSAPVTFATAAQARACTNTTTSLSPSLFQESHLAWMIVNTGANGTGNVANGGTTNGTGYAPFISVSTTANSTAMWRAFTSNSTGWNVGTSYTSNQAVDWSKPRAFQIRLTTDGTHSTNQVCRVQWGKDINATTLGQIASQGIGFEIRNGRVWLTAHNGTSLAAVDSQQTLSTGYYSTYDFLVTSDGAGNVALFINGTQYATTASGPTTVSSSIIGTLAVELTNGGDATAGSFRWQKYVAFLNGR